MNLMRRSNLDILVVDIIERSHHIILYKCVHVLYNIIFSNKLGFILETSLLFIINSIYVD
jgi:hypothetical protein